MLEHLMLYNIWFYNAVCGATTLSITTPSMMTLTIRGLFVTLSITRLFHYAECRVLFTTTLNAIMLNVIMLNVIMLNVIMLSVIMLSLIMLCIIMLSVFMLNVVTLSVVQPCVSLCLLPLL